MIIYTLIAKGSLVLVEYTEADGDFPQLVRKILVSVKKDQEKQLFSKEEYVFCILSNGEYKYITMIHQNSSKEKGFRFLEAIRDEYLKDHENTNYSNSKFTSKICQMMHGFNKLDQKDALSNLEDSVDDLQNSASANLMKMIQRETELDVLVEKTKELTQNADLIYYHSRKVKESFGEQGFRLGGKLFCFAFNLFMAASVYIYLTL